MKFLIVLNDRLRKSSLGLAFLFSVQGIIGNFFNLRMFSLQTSKNFCANQMN